MVRISMYLLKTLLLHFGFYELWNGAVHDVKMHLSLVFIIRQEVPNIMTTSGFTLL